MARVWYGSLQNRLAENKQFVPQIEVGTGMTEYSYSDRHAYEVVAVEDQKHVTVREYDHRLKGGAYSNDWELISNPDNVERDMVKRGDYWYWASTVTKDMIDSYSGDIPVQLALAMSDFDYDKIIAKGKQTKYRRANVSFGVASYYYDYEF